MPLQKHDDLFAETLQWFAEDIPMKNRKARKRPKKVASGGSEWR
jgi:hypothetical protein